MKQRKNSWLLGFNTSAYGSAVTENNDANDRNDINTSDDIELTDHDAPSSPLIDVADMTPENSNPLLFFYDCETTGGSHHQDYIMEIASEVLLLDNITITKSEFASLCHTSRRIVQKGSNLCVNTEIMYLLFQQYLRNVV